MKEALYYHKTDDGGVQCDLCPHGCNIAKGRRGICGSRINEGGVLNSLAYGKPCSLAIDPVQKKPLLHFHPGMTCLSLACTGCNFRCLNCQNHDISQILPEGAANYALSPAEVVDLCEQKGCKSIAYTYTEPLTYLEYIRDIAAIARSRGILNILVSAGYVNQAPLSDLSPLLDAANIDLKSFSDALYRRVNGGTLQPVLDTLLALKSAGVWLEITNLLIPCINDDPSLIRQMCIWLREHGFAGKPLHFSRFFPAYKMMDKPVTPLETLIGAAAIAKKEGIEYVYVGNAPDCEGEDTVCPSCGRVLVRREGFRILDNHLSTGFCPFCGCKIPGHWSTLSL